MKSIQSNIAVLILSGIGLLSIHAVNASLSHQFIFGQGYQQRPIITFVVLMGLAGVLYLIALEIIRKSDSMASHPMIIYFICMTALMMRLFYSSSGFIQETDPYRYVWDGQAIVQGVNPYQYSPQEAMQNNFRPASNNPIAQDVYRKINHEGVRTIYPPLAQGLFALSQWLTPWKITAWKWMVGLADCAIIGLLIAIFGRMNIPKAWVIIYAWSPLVIKEFSNSVHLDVFALLMLSLMIYALVRGWQMTAFIALAGAVLIKLFAIVLLPLLICRRFKDQKRYLLQNFFIFFSILILSYLPFLNAGAFLTEGLGRFLSEWQTNEGLFGLIRWAVSLFPMWRDLQMLFSRFISVCLFGAGLTGILFWLRKENGIHSLMKAMAVALAMLFFLLPTGNPWYYTWAVLFIPFLPLRALILFSVLVFVYYLDFYFTYQESKSMFVIVRWIEYGLFFFILGVELCRRRLPLLFRS
jgi:hypothetical protein